MSGKYGEGEDGESKDGRGWLSAPVAPSVKWDIEGPPHRVGRELVFVKHLEQSLARGDAQREH